MKVEELVPRHFSHSKFHESLSKEYTSCKLIAWVREVYGHDPVTMKKNWRSCTLR